MYFKPSFLEITHKPQCSSTELGNKRLFNTQMVMPLLRFLPDTSPRETRWKTGQRKQGLLDCI